MTPVTPDPLQRAMNQRAQVPAARFCAMLGSQLYLAVGFVGASIAAGALRLLVTSEASRYSPFELALAAAACAAIAVLTWYRAVRALDHVAPHARETISATAGQDFRALGTFSRG